jgi:DNA-binding MarR family transcriptional regulator
VSEDLRVEETDAREGAAATRKAVAALRAALFDGDLAPGQRLVEGDLAEMYGVSRASVRAALIDLAADGLIERIPNRGARVRVVSVAEAVAITECRMVLEGLCAAKAAAQATDEQIAVLTGLGEQMQAAVAGGDPMKYSALNRELHPSCASTPPSRSPPACWTGSTASSSGTSSGWPCAPAGRRSRCPSTWRSSTASPGATPPRRRPPPGRT